MTPEEINQFAQSWAEQHQGIGIGMSLPQILGQFGCDLQKFIDEKLSEIVLGDGEDAATQD